MRVSCNAYFAQLGVAVGPARAARHRRPLRHRHLVAGHAWSGCADSCRGRRTARPRCWRRRSRWRAWRPRSPTMAWRRRTGAAADGAGGMRRRLQFGATTRPVRRQRPRRVCWRRSRRDASARAMRSVVTSGTAHGLMAGGDPNMAGKTGTAEVTGAASHSWFVGYRAGDGGDAEDDRLCRDRGEWRLRRVGRGAPCGRGGRGRAHARPGEVGSVASGTDLPDSSRRSSVCSAGDRRASRWKCGAR